MAVGAGVAFGDNIVSDVKAGNGLGQNVDFAAGGSGSVYYWIEATGNSCDAADGSSATVTIDPPAGLVATPSRLEFSECGEEAKQEVLFTSTTPGVYENVEVTVTDAAGSYSTGQAKITVRVASPGSGGARAPVVTLDSVSPAANANGWNNGDVEIRWSIDDGGSPLTGTSAHCGAYDAADDQWVYTLSTEGADQTLTCTAQNAVGSDSEDAGPISLDKTKPAVTLSGFTAGQSVATGAEPSASCAVNDALSGLASDSLGSTVSVDRAQVGANGLGTVTVTCSGGATDNAGNVADPASRSYVIDSYGGVGTGECLILQPILCDTLNLFSRGKSVPTKFRLDGDGAGTPYPNGFATSGWRMVRVSSACVVGANGTDDQVSEQTSSASTYIRYDAAADQYIWNADFRDKSVGTCWHMRVDLTPTQSGRSAVLRLQK